MPITILMRSLQCKKLIARLKNTNKYKQKFKNVLFIVENVFARIYAEAILWKIEKTVEMNQAV